ncbi:transposase [Salinibacter altiplanensis]|uniref:transposase n=1 Tax=Salinibacter altiplanensis TaxID=1803181 RepID=UPI000C9F2383
MATDFRWPLFLRLGSATNWPFSLMQWTPWGCRGLSGGPSSGLRRPKGDRAYDSKENRRWCWERNIESVIPARNGMHTGAGRPPTCDEQKYKRRNVVERLVGRLKERRRVATCYEKKASHTGATAPQRCSSGPSSASI